VDEAFAWLDHHVLGAQNEVAAWPQVTAQVMFEPVVREGYAAWQDATADSERLHLGAVAPGSQDGTLGPEPEAGWMVSFTAGTLTERPPPWTR
jgi:hypothetical protein